MKIHPVFHTTVLEPAHLSIPIVTQVPALEADNKKERYNVEKVLESQLVDGKLQYLVKWNGYSMNNNTWEPASQFTGLPLPPSGAAKDSDAAGKSERESTDKNGLSDREAAATEGSSQIASALSCSSILQSSVTTMVEWHWQRATICFWR